MNPDKVECRACEGTGQKRDEPQYSCRRCYGYGYLVPNAAGIVANVLERDAERQKIQNRTQEIVERFTQ